MVERVRGGDRRYTGDEVDILYNLGRCIHAEFCVSRLAAVFDKQKRPWINANGAPADEIVSVIELCPSGALHYERKDGVRELPSRPNTLLVRTNGPLTVRGELELSASSLPARQETRMTLCRCGGSQNKPFCDNSHLHNGFEPGAPTTRESASEPPGAGALTVHACPNGPLELRGPVRIVNEAHEILYEGQAVNLCRCGHSGHKPFCDGTHRHIGFTAE